VLNRKESLIAKTYLYLSLPNTSSFILSYLISVKFINVFHAFTS